VAANIFSNYLNHYIQAEPDLPAAPGLEAGHRPGENTNCGPLHIAAEL
jgi:hypothetical protein